MAKVTNNRKAGHTIFTQAGAVNIRPGQSRDVELTETEAEEIRSAGLDVEQDGEGAGLSSMKVDDLKALAEEEGIDLGDATKKADIVSAIELAREEAGQQ